MIKIELDLDESKAKAKLDDFKGVAQNQGRKSGESFSKGFSIGSGALSVAIGSIVADIARRSAQAIKNLVSDSIQAAQVQEDAINKLNAALAKNGNFTQQASQELQSFASQLQLVSRVGDESVLSQLAFAQSLGATVEQSKRIVTAAADLSEALGISFESAVRNVTKTLGGLKGELGEAIPELGALTKEQLQAGAAIDVVANKFRGAAAASVGTFAGQVNQLQKNYGDLNESIGFFITKSPIFTEVLKSVNSAILSINKSVSGGDGIKSATLAVLDFGEALNKFVIAPLELTFNAARFVFAKINEFVAASVAVIGQGAGAIGKALNFFGVDNSLSQGLQNFAESSNEVFQQVAQDSQQAFDSIFDGSLFGKTEQFIERVRQNVEAAKVAVEETQINANTSAAQNSITRIGEVAKQTGQIVKSGLANVISQSIQQVIKNIAAGENAFSGFAKLLFNLFGDIAIQIGQALILAGLGIEALFSLSGAAAIAAGAGLVAVGAILKTFAGGGSSPSAGLDNSANTFANDPATQQVTDDQRNNPQTGVVVNIQGDVLDSNETSLRIADLLQKAVSDQGVRFSGLA